MGGSDEERALRKKKKKSKEDDRFNAVKSAIIKRLGDTCDVSLGPSFLYDMQRIHARRSMCERICYVKFQLRLLLRDVHT